MPNKPIKPINPIKMKKLFLLAFLPLFLMACQRDAATEVQLRMTEIYEDVLGHYRSASRNGTLPDASVFEEKYYSARFLKATRNEDFRDSDPWIQGQDWPECIHATTDSVREVTPDSVIAHITIYNFEPVRVDVIMIRERGNWYIDDFLSSLTPEPPSFEGAWLDDDNNEPNLTLSLREDGSYDVAVGIFRLTNLDDGIGILTDEGLAFTATDAAGNPIGGIISFDGDTATVTFTQTTWGLIEPGSAFKYHR